MLGIRALLMERMNITVESLEKNSPQPVAGCRLTPTIESLIE
jgi:hypothetical protein